MRKADRLDGLRSEIGVMSDRCSRNLCTLYTFVCDVLFEKMAYEWVAIYLAKETKFTRIVERGKAILPQSIPFGEELLSIAAARGGAVREKTNNRTEVYVPFYHGQYLIGIIAVAGSAQSVDDEDVTFFCELASLFETKGKEANF